MATFNAGQSTLNQPVGIVNDGTHEGHENFSVQFTVVMGQSVEADPTRQMATVTITDAEDSEKSVLNWRVLLVILLSCVLSPPRQLCSRGVLVF